MAFRLLRTLLLGGMNEEREKAGSLAALGMTSQKKRQVQSTSYPVTHSDKVLSLSNQLHIESGFNRINLLTWDK